MAIPFKSRPGHQWLAPLLNTLGKTIDIAAPSGYIGAQGGAFGADVPITRVGNASGTVGVYGITGIAQLATGTAGITGVTGAGGMTAFSVVWFNGGTGAYYTISDIVTALKNIGILKR
jgi:hypothetical protein